MLFFFPTIAPFALSKAIKNYRCVYLSVDIVSQHFELRSEHTVTCRTKRLSMNERTFNTDRILDRCLGCCVWCGSACIQIRCCFNFIFITAMNGFFTLHCYTLPSTIDVYNERNTHPPHVSVGYADCHSISIARTILVQSLYCNSGLRLIFAHFIF